MRRIVAVIAFAFAFAFVCAPIAASAADPVGTYTIKGTSPGSSKMYKGTVTITKTGETYRVIWVIAGTRYVGTGIGDKSFLAVSYKSDDQTGLALYGADGGNWTGVWTYAGGKELGAEAWNRD